MSDSEYEERATGGDRDSGAHGRPLWRPSRTTDSTWCASAPLSALRCPSTRASLFNSLSRGRELCSSTDRIMLNDAGALARKSDNGKFYCGLKVHITHSYKPFCLENGLSQHSPQFSRLG
jgi:hypothetical protein